LRERAGHGLLDDLQAAELFRSFSGWRKSYGLIRWPDSLQAGYDRGDRVLGFELRNVALRSASISRWLSVAFSAAIGIPRVKASYPAAIIIGGVLAIPLGLRAVSRIATR
jgi:hypothetical protein